MTSLAHNTTNDTRFEDMLARAKKLGAESVKGSTSKPAHAAELVRGIVEGVLDTQDKLDAHWDAYGAARAKEIAKNPTLQGMSSDNDKSLKAQRSKQKQIELWANLPIMKSSEDDDAVAELDVISTLRTNLIKGEVAVKPLYDCYVDVARAQLKQPLERITSEVMEKVIAKPEAKSKDLIQKLREQYSRIYKLGEAMAEDMIDCTHIEAARDALADAIVALDGEVPSMSKADKKDDEMVGFLMAKGYSKADARAIVAAK